MAGARDAKERVGNISRDAIERALGASIKSGSMTTFYGWIGMRNPSRSYFVRYNGHLHSLKAVVAYALQENGAVITASDFHAVYAAKRLIELKFDVVHNSTETDHERERIWISRLSRPYHLKFRDKLIDIYGGCALSGCTTLPALEAAHVNPVAEKGSDKSTNGILLRADLHKLFDANLIAIHPKSGLVSVAATCIRDYGNELESRTFTPRKNGPPLAAFNVRWDIFKSADK